MIEIERHIEILLLNNDCVIVPGLGGFMAHHVEARYDESEHLFMPPMRTLGFNPQLKLNDSLLAQSYVEAYDISYPEAVRRIESEVGELKQHLDNEGSYSLNAIGTLTVNEEGNYVFEPCEAGIQTPSLYGLCPFEMETLEAKRKALAEAALTENKDNAAIAETSNQTDNKTIRIKVAWIRNVVAAAAAILAFVLFTTPVTNSITPGLNMSGMHPDAITKIIPKEITKGEVSVSTNQIRQSLAMTTDTTANTDTTTLRKVMTMKTSSKQAPEATAQDKYCIVMASHIPLRNAEELVGKLHDKGYEQAYTYRHNNIVRVVYGHYKSEEEAYNELRNVRGNENFEQSWVLKKK